MPHPSIVNTPLPWRHYAHPRYWATWIGLGVLRLIALLPSQAAWFLGGVLGELLYAVYSSRRHVATRNVERCLPDLGPDQRRRLVRRNFRATAHAALQMGYAWWASRARLQAMVRVRGEEIFRQATASGRPVILLLGHFVAVEMCGMWLASLRPVIDIYKRPRNELLHEVIKRRRLRFGGTLLEFREGLKPVIRALRRGEVLCYLPDQDPGRRNSVFVPFLGIETATFSVLGRLSRLTDAIVLPCSSRQLPWGRGVEVVFGAPLRDFPSGDDVSDATNMNRAIESAVRAMPDQYFWVHKRFKTRPPGAPDFYRDG